MVNSSSKNPADCTHNLILLFIFDFVEFFVETLGLLTFRRVWFCSRC